MSYSKELDTSKFVAFFSINGINLKETAKLFSPSTTEKRLVALVEVKNYQNQETFSFGLPHFGIIVGDQLYFLSLIEDSNSSILRIQFNNYRIREAEYAIIEQYGETAYVHEEILKIGDTLLAKFGSYHIIFWNLPKFISLLLEILCHNPSAPRHWQENLTVHEIIVSSKDSKAKDDARKTEIERESDRVILSLVKRSNIIAHSETTTKGSGTWCVIM